MVYVFFAEGFEEVEALTSVDVLRRAQIPVKMVGISGTNVLGAHGISVQMDALLSEIGDAEDAEMLMLPGGMPGTKGLPASEELKALLKKAESKGKMIGAICAAPTVLAAANVYSGHRVTHYPGYEAEMSDYQVVDEDVVSDGNLTTGRSIGCATQFALKLVEQIRGRDIRLKVEAAMMMPQN